VGKQAECLRMVVQAERRMVLEIEDGQARGEVASQDHGGANSGVRGADTVPATFKDLGLDRRRVRLSNKQMDSIYPRIFAVP
jgi:hypothetical protein